MKLTGIREQVFSDRYALKDDGGHAIEKDPVQMWRRVAAAISMVEKPKERKNWEKKFYKAMENFRYVPGGRILAGAGTKTKVTFYNCFVIPSPHDSREGILQTLSQMVEIMARGGGVGINLSSLRPRGAYVRKVNGHSSGPCNWAELFSVATKDIIQQGGSRRGALMLMLWDWHPDVEEFITVKRDLSRINGANLSVCVSDKFMAAVKKDMEWELKFPDINDAKYEKEWDGDMDEWVKKGGKVKVAKKVSARKMWDLICEAAWGSAEPGVVFMERYNKWFNNWYWEKVNCVNPCGEEGLPPWGVCNLGSINLSQFVYDGKMDYKGLFETAKVAVRFQDDVVDADIYVFEEIRKVQLLGERRIGVGTMGLGDALIKMKIRYGSDESIKVIDKIYKIIRDSVYEASIEIAAEKGAFPKFDKKKYMQGYFIKKLPENLKKKMVKHGIRNSILTQQAPTGSTSLLSGTTSGIEPVYEFSFIRRDRLGEHILYHPLFEEWKKNHPKDPVPDYFVSANDLTPADHVKVQAAIQEYVDASISKTVNAPNNHTVEDVKKLYMLAYDLGCKGVTYMREGSRPGVLERTDAKKEEGKAAVTIDGKSKPNGGKVYMPEIKPRPMMVSGATYQIDTPVGTAFVTINTNGNEEPLEVFINVGKAGSDVAAMAEALGRVISAMLRVASPLPARDRAKQIFNQLIGIGGSKSLGFGDKRVRSLPDAVAKALAMHLNFKLKNGNGAHVASEVKEELKPVSVVTQQTLPASISDMELCPSCGEASLAYEEGCKKCYSCGYSEC